MAHRSFEHSLKQNATKVAVISSASCFREGRLYTVMINGSILLP